MANIFNDDWDDPGDSWVVPTTPPIPNFKNVLWPSEPITWPDSGRGTTAPTSSAYSSSLPPIGPGFAPWVDRWDGLGPNVSGTTPGQVPPNTPSYYGPGEYAGSGGGSFDFLGSGALFDDPATKQFVDILTGYMDRLTGPANIPGLEGLRGAVQTRIGQLSTPFVIPEMEDFKAALRGIANESFTPNAELETALRAISDRIGQLNAPPFTALEEKGQEVKAFDGLEREKQAARQQIMERMAARGIGAGSGIIESAIQQSDRFFDQMRSERTGDLLEYRTDVGERRKNQAIDLGVTAGGLRGGELDRSERFTGRKVGALGQIAQVAGTEAGINESRADQIVDLSSMLADLGFQEYGLDNSRGLQRVQLAALLPDLVERRLGLAINAANGTSSSTMPFGSSLSNLFGQSLAGRTNAPRGTDYSGLFLGLGDLLSKLIPQK